MQFLVDAQLPPALARWLEAHGHQAMHVMDLGMGAAPDSAIWQFAAQDGWVILTKDQDFATWRVDRAGTEPAVVWLRLGNTRRAELLRWFECLLPEIVTELNRGERLVEVR